MVIILGMVMAAHGVMVVVHMVVMMAHTVMVVAHMVMVDQGVTVVQTITPGQEADGTPMRTITIHLHPHHVLIAVKLPQKLKKKNKLILLN
jgi:hypothetical protein